MVVPTTFGDVVCLPFELLLFLAVLIIQSITFFFVALSFLPLWVMQKTCSFKLNPPFDKENIKFRSDVLLLTVPNDDGLYMRDSIADQIERLAQEYTKLTSGRIRCMISDDRFGQAFAKVTKTSVERLFWKIVWKYPNIQHLGPHGQLHYHAVLSIRREVDDRTEFEEFKKSLLALGLDMICYQVVREKVLEHEGDDHYERFARIGFGRSAVWEIPTMQRIARYDALMIWGEKTTVDIRKRIMYWTKILPEQQQEGEQSFAFISHESHNTLEEMLYENWRCNLTLWNQMFFLSSGFSNLLYSGLARNRTFQENSVSFSDVRRQVGLFHAVLGYMHRMCFFRIQSASNQAMMARTRVFDYRDDVHHGNHNVLTNPATMGTSGTSGDDGVKM